MSKYVTSETETRLRKARSLNRLNKITRNIDGFLYSAATETQDALLSIHHNLRTHEALMGKIGAIYKAIRAARAAVVDAEQLIRSQRNKAEGKA